MIESKITDNIKCLMHSHRYILQIYISVVVFASEYSIDICGLPTQQGACVFSDITYRSALIG